MLQAGWQGRRRVRMITRGDPLDRLLATQLLARGAGLWNLYGPTEATVYAAGKQIENEDARIAIGRPLANTIARVLDRNQRLVPAGAVEEFYLGGVQLGSGYLNRPDLTTERFIADPYRIETDDPIEADRIGTASRLYRTGDLARLLPNGEIDALGRIDNQVKLRGYRIELEEIESALDSHPAVRKSAAKVVDYAQGDQRMAAYAAETGDKPALTDTGCDELEQTTLEIWRKVLRIPTLALDDNFFDVGGHSLLALRIFAEIHGSLGRRLPLEAPTPCKLAQRLGKPDTSEESCRAALKGGGSLPPLYLIRHLYGDVPAYRWLANCIPPERPVFGIQASAKIKDLGRQFSIESASACYVNQILARQPAGPFRFAGFSSGALIAFEIARQLTAMGRMVGLLCFMDADIPAPGPKISLAARCCRIAVRKTFKVVFKFKKIRKGPKQFVMKRLKSVRLRWSIKHLEFRNSPAGRTSPCRNS